MAKITQRATVGVDVGFFQLDEPELRALDALVGYGADAFIEGFYKVMGKAYLQPHEAGLRSLFESVRLLVPPILHRADGARKVFEGTHEAKPREPAS